MHVTAIRFVTCLLLFSGGFSLGATSADYIKNHAVKAEADQVPASLVNTFKTKKLILVGEIHGTNEMPASALQFINAINFGQRILVGVEFPADIQAEVSHFMKTGDVTPLKKTAFFTDSFYHSGRGSQAMMAFLDSLRRNENVEVFCFDVPDNYKGTTRDTDMASNILQKLTAEGNPQTVIFTGNIHSRLTNGVSWNPHLKTMGAEILRLSNGFYDFNNSDNLLFRMNEGSSWTCMTDDTGKIKCETYFWKPANRDYATAVNFDYYFLREPATEDGHRNTFFIRKVSASLPF
jgi:hypothetical protein